MRLALSSMFGGFILLKTLRVCVRVCVCARVDRGSTEQALPVRPPCPLLWRHVSAICFLWNNESCLKTCLDDDSWKNVSLTYLCGAPPVSQASTGRSTSGSQTSAPSGTPSSPRSPPRRHVCPLILPLCAPPVHQTQLHLWNWQRQRVQGSAVRRRPRWRRSRWGRYAHAQPAAACACRHIL